MMIIVSYSVEFILHRYYLRYYLYFTVNNSVIIYKLLLKLTMNFRFKHVYAIHNNILNFNYLPLIANNICDFRMSIKNCSQNSSLYSSFPNVDITLRCIPFQN